VIDLARCGAGRARQPRAAEVGLCATYAEADKRSYRTRASPPRNPVGMRAAAFIWIVADEALARPQARVRIARKHRCTAC